MTDTQLYIAAGLPTVAVLVGILMNMSLFNSLSARLLPLENKVHTKLELAAGKLADGLHLLCLPVLFLQFALFGDVARNF